MNARGYDCFVPAGTGCGCCYRGLVVVEGSAGRMPKLLLCVGWVGLGWGVRA
jgi:hypothetical protein